MGWLDSRYDAVAKWKTQPVYNESTGTWTGVSAEKEMICRASPAGVSGSGSSKYTFIDGIRIDYTFDIAFPFNSTEIPKAGDQVEFYGTTGELIYKGVLIRIHKGSFSIRAWA